MSELRSSRQVRCRKEPVKEELVLITRDFREAVLRGDNDEEESTFRSLISCLSPDVSFEVVRERLMMFLPTFEAYAPDSTWARRFLESAAAWFGGTDAVVEPVDFALEEEKHSFAGAGNYVSGLEELWLAIRNKADRKEFERWIFHAAYNCAMADLGQLWAKLHPELWSRSSKVVAAAGNDSLNKQDSLLLAREYLAMRADGRLRARRAQIWLDVAERIEQLVKTSVSSG